MSDDECKVHLVRFYKWQPRAIHCLAYEPNHRKLAVSRADHSVEVWDLTKQESAPHTECVIPNLKDNSVEALVWSGKRLFSAGFQGFVVEYDLRTLSRKYMEAVTAGPAWCMAVDKSGKYLAVGTEDGYINLFSVIEEGMRYDKIMDKQEGRIMCIEWENTGEMIVTGSLDTIRIWDVRTGHAIHKMITGRKNNKPTIVWCVTVTDDFTVISGDSRGHLTFWNGQNGTQVESFETHPADILTVCTDGPHTVFASGVDPTIVTFQREKVGDVQSKRMKWMRHQQWKRGDHDIRALAMAHGSLISGGVDGSLCISKPGLRVMKYPCLMQEPVMMMSRDAQCFLLRYPSQLEVWQLDTKGASQEPPTRLLALDSCGGHPITCAAISPNARWLIYSTPLICRFFTFVPDPQAPHLQKITNLPEEIGPADKAVFTGDSTYAVVATYAGQILFLHLNPRDLGEVTLVHSWKPLEDKLLTDRIFLLQVSEDGKFLAAADHQSHIVVWMLEDRKVHCSLPQYNFPPTVLAFEPGTNNIVVVYSDKKVVEYNVHKRCFTHFSNNMKWPNVFKEIKSAIIGITFNRRNPNVFIIYDRQNMFVIRKEFYGKKDNVARDLETPVRQPWQRRRPKLNKNGMFCIKKYKYIVQLDWLVENELVVVQLPMEDMIEKLPAILKKPKHFGI